MFTGIVETIGTIRSISAVEQGVNLTIAAPAFDLSDVHIGDSIAVNGACLTATNVVRDRFTADVSQATLDCVARFEAGAQVNLEKALRLSDRLGGHLVSGHVDGVGEVARFEPVGEN